MKIISTRRGGFLRGWLTLILVLALIAAVSGWFIARTQGFKGMLETQLSERMGVPVRIEKSYIGWPYVLVLRGVEAEDDAMQLHVRTARLGRRLRQWTLDIRGARVIFSPAVLEDGFYRYPATLVRIADLRDAGAMDIMRATADLQLRWRLSVHDADLFWQDTDGEIDGGVRQLQFNMQPVRLPSGTFIYYRLAYPGRAEYAFGSMRDLDWEWLTRGGDHYIELERSGVAPLLDMCE